MKFKDGDRVKVVLFSPDFIEETTYDSRVGEVITIKNRGKDNYYRKGFIYQDEYGVFYKQHHLKLMPIFKTKIYKALTEGE